MASQSGGRIAYINARLLDPATGLDAPGALLTEGEAVADFGAGLFADGVPDGIAVIDCHGQCLAPGLVDLRVQLREPGEEYKETLASGGRAAAAGGVTSMVALPNTDPVCDDVSVVEFVARRARQLALAKVYVYAAATKGLKGKDLAEMGMLSEAGAAAVTDGPLPIADSQVMRRCLAYASNFGLVVVQRPEDPSLAGGGVMNQGELATRLGLGGIPREAEIIMVERDLRLAAMTGGRLHFSLLSTSDSIDAVRQAKARGLTVTCDTAPPYFALNENAVGDYRTFAKLSPPLRGEDDRQAIVEGLKDGTIDAIVSDHAPQDEEEKRQPFATAAFGSTGLETLLALTLELHHNGHVDLLQALALVTSKAADLLALGAGRLDKGAPADLVLFDPERAWKADADKLLSKSKNSAFDGRLLQGRVLRTVVDGRSVFVGED